MTNKNAYAQSGVDVEAGYEVVERIKKHVARTERWCHGGAGWLWWHVRPVSDWGRSQC